MDVQPDVRVADRDIGTAPRPVTELVDDGILHLIRDKARIGELLGIHDGIDREGLSLEDIFAPVYLLHFLVHILCAPRLEVCDGFKDADGGVQLEVGTVHHFLVTGKRHHAASYLYVVGA